ncbi:MAG: cytochrome c oxidase subunit II [Planctomycetia bacterium]|nr:MAG: cytochrome c oxidase subunit II [Planctomycetia bacterium]
MEAMMTGILADSLGLMPPKASTFAPAVDFWFDFTLWVSIFFFVLIIGLMLLFMVKYRRRPGVRAVVTPTHSTALELSWTVIPTILVVIMFWGGFKTYMDQRVMPLDAYEIGVNAKQWAWEFTYPNGIRHPELHVPKDVPVVLTMYSDDVLHSFFIPAFRVKMDVMRGRYTKLWFQATLASPPGQYYPVLCTEYCGTSHSTMTTKCVVHETRAEFEQWLRDADPLKKLTPEQYDEYLRDPSAFIAAHPDIQGLQSPADMGRKLWDSKGCKQCHSIDGKVGTGPSWSGIWGQTHEFSNAPPTAVDENYVKESIVNPRAKALKGYAANAMPTYQGRITDREIDSIIAFIKTLKSGSEAK